MKDIKEICLPGYLEIAEKKNSKKENIQSKKVLQSLQTKHKITGIWNRLFHRGSLKDRGKITK